MIQQNENLERLFELSHFSVERAPDAILWVGSDGQIYRVNETACKLFGFAAEELIGKKIYALNPEEDDQFFRDVWLDLQRQKILQFETYIFKKDGEKVPVEISANLIAHTIHSASKRRHRPMIKINCAALLPNLIESELFGHEKGAAKRLGVNRRIIGITELQIFVDT